jgi:hypothetical protein
MSAASTSLLPRGRALAAAIGIWAYCGLILFAMRRPPICPCGRVRLWSGVVQSPENSQQVADWYSFSHVIHGLLFYAGAHLLWRKWKLFGGAPAGWALPIAVAIEGSWELLENSPLINDRYRAVTLSWGYSGDSILNSMCDIGWMAVGFWLASRLPAWASIALGVFLELFTLYFIRDNLTLNVLMLVWPLQAIRQWQAMG